MLRWQWVHKCYGRGCMGENGLREDQVCAEPRIQIMLSQMVWVLHLTLVECQVLVDPPEPGSLQGEGQERVEDVAAKGVHPQISLQENRM